MDNKEDQVKSLIKRASRSMEDRDIISAKSYIQRAFYLAVQLDLTIAEFDAIGHRTIKQENPAYHIGEVFIYWGSLLNKLAHPFGLVKKYSNALSMRIDDEEEPPTQAVLRGTWEAYKDRSSIVIDHFGIVQGCATYIPRQGGPKEVLFKSGDGISIMCEDDFLDKYSMADK